MGILEALWRWWQASRLLCHFCGQVPVYEPGDYCSDECAECAYWHNKAA